mmetsp:Transcript_96370/g.206846  ORF Transcript_96370/g.206846 Transcript_96370/m.206846 type:complete len:245 (-) Transcript_96370:129-863(-)
MPAMHIQPQQQFQDEDTEEDDFSNAVGGRSCGQHLHGHVFRLEANLKTISHNYQDGGDLESRTLHHFRQVESTVRDGIIIFLQSGSRRLPRDQAHGALGFIGYFVLGVLEDRYQSAWGLERGQSDGSRDCRDSQQWRSPETDRRLIFNRMGICVRQIFQGRAWKLEVGAALQVEVGFSARCPPRLLLLERRVCCISQRLAWKLEDKVSALLLLPRGCLLLHGGHRLQSEGFAKAALLEWWIEAL